MATAAAVLGAIYLAPGLERLVDAGLVLLLLAVVAMATARYW